MHCRQYNLIGPIKPLGPAFCRWTPHPVLGFCGAFAAIADSPGNAQYAPSVGSARKMKTGPDWSCHYESVQLLRNVVAIAIPEVTLWIAGDQYSSRSQSIRVDQ